MHGEAGRLFQFALAGNSAIIPAPNKRRAARRVGNSVRRRRTDVLRLCSGRRKTKTSIGTTCFRAWDGLTGGATANLSDGPSPWALLFPRSLPCSCILSTGRPFDGLSTKRWWPQYGLRFLILSVPPAIVASRDDSSGARPSRPQRVCAEAAEDKFLRPGLLEPLRPGRPRAVSAGVCPALTFRGRSSSFHGQ